MPGLWDGLAHPILGVDHLAAMVCVGVVSAILGRCAMWVVPSAFVLAMAVGGVLGLSAVAVPRAEALIATSLVALGVVIATVETMPRTRLAPPTWLAVASVALFGIAHGNAHGAEMPSTANPLEFTIGFLIGTSGLHLFGVFAGTSAVKFRWSTLAMRMSGVFTAAMGLGLLVR